MSQQSTLIVDCHVSKCVPLANMADDVVATSAMTWQVYEVRDCRFVRYDVAGSSVRGFRLIIGTWYSANGRLTCVLKRVSTRLGVRANDWQ
ncbi:hypothetical protein Tco_0238782 [Tanacetum coccineum]